LFLSINNEPKTKAAIPTTYVTFVLYLEMKFYFFPEFLVFHFDRVLHFLDKSRSVIYAKSAFRESPNYFTRLDSYSI